MTFYFGRVPPPSPLRFFFLLLFVFVVTVVVLGVRGAGLKLSRGVLCDAPHVAHFISRIKSSGPRQIVK